MGKKLCSHHGEILDVPLIFVKVMERGDEENQHHHFAAPVSADPRLTLWDRVVLIAICRLYDSYADANRVVIGLEAAGIAPSETSLISNNSDTWLPARERLQCGSAAEERGEPRYCDQRQI